jgi:hypothetical protein
MLHMKERGEDPTDFLFGLADDFLFARPSRFSIHNSFRKNRHRRFRESDAKGRPALQPCRSEIQSRPRADPRQNSRVATKPFPPDRPMRRMLCTQVKRAPQTSPGRPDKPQNPIP